MQVIKHVRNMYDIFFGVGYNIHSRIQVRGLDAVVMAGQPLSAEKLRTLAKEIKPNAHYQTLAE